MTDEDLCTFCDGTGEGKNEGACCPYCDGTGLKAHEPEDWL